MDHVKQLMATSTHELFRILRRIRDLRNQVPNVSEIKTFASLVHEDFRGNDQQCAMLLLGALIARCDQLQQKFEIDISISDVCPNCHKKTMSSDVINQLTLDVYQLTFDQMLKEACQPRISTMK